MRSLHIPLFIFISCLKSSMNRFPTAFSGSPSSSHGAFFHWFLQQQREHNPTYPQASAIAAVRRQPTPAGTAAVGLTQLSSAFLSHLLERISQDGQKCRAPPFYNTVTPHCSPQFFLTLYRQKANLGLEP